MIDTAMANQIQTAAPPGPGGTTQGWIQARLAPYRRITSSGAFIPEIDSFRFVAILFVFLHHLSQNVLQNTSASQLAVAGRDWLARVAGILNFGVPLFFVVSGFVLGMPFAEMYLKQGKNVSLKKYFLRRVTRLEPPYILALLLLLMVKLVAGRGSFANYLPHLLASIFYVHNAVYGTFSTINVVAWSLEVEIQFYLLAPVLALIFAIRPMRLRRVSLCFLILATTYLSHMIPFSSRLTLSLAGYAQYFLAGLLLADIHVTAEGRYGRRLGWDGVSLAGWPLLIGLLTVAPGAIPWIAPWLISLLYQAAFRASLTKQFFVNTVITTIGGMCYTIYLLHNYLIYITGLITERVLNGAAFEVRMLVQFMLITPIVLAVSALYFRFVERPCMRPDWVRSLTYNVRGGFFKMHARGAAAGQ